MSFIQGLKFGNVYGLRNEILNTIKNPQGILSTLQGALAQEETTPGFTDPLGANIFEGEIVAGSTQVLETSNIMPPGQPARQLPSGNNIFGQSPSGPAPLESSNIFE